MMTAYRAAEELFMTKTDEPNLNDPIDDLLRIMAKLRDPDTGCPWDLEQNFRSIAPYTLEEAYEVADAIERGDSDDLRDELGDLLLQVVFHAQMAKEEGLFDFDDVVQGICDKMIRRHPHVFATGDGDTPEHVARNWEAIKESEKAAKGASDGPSHILDDVPVNLPALIQAVKLQKKAARVGFDWPQVENVLEKLREETDELLAEIKKDSMDSQAAFEEFGDLLFVYTNFARHLKIDPEAALRSTNMKFRRRFRRIEEILYANASSTAEASLDDMDALWTQAKFEEKTN